MEIMNNYCTKFKRLAGLSGSIDSDISQDEIDISPIFIGSAKLKISEIIDLSDPMKQQAIETVAKLILLIELYNEI